MNIIKLEEQELTQPFGFYHDGTNYCLALIPKPSSSGASLYCYKPELQEYFHIKANCERNISHRRIYFNETIKHINLHGNFYFKQSNGTLIIVGTIATQNYSVHIEINNKYLIKKLNFVYSNTDQRTAKRFKYNKAIDSKFTNNNSEYRLTVNGKYDSENSKLSFFYCKNESYKITANNNCVFAFSKLRGNLNHFNTCFSLSIERSIIDAQFSPDGETLAIANESSIELYRSCDFKLINIFKTGLTDSIKYITWAKDNLTFAVATKNELQIWDFD